MQTPQRGNNTNSPIVEGDRTESKVVESAMEEEAPPRRLSPDMHELRVGSQDIDIILPQVLHTHKHHNSFANNVGGHRDPMALRQAQCNTRK